MAIIERMFRGLGPDGRVGVKSLIDSRRFLPQDLTLAGYLTFKNTCTMLPDFFSLTTLSLAINEHYLFRNDQLALEDLFLCDQELNADGLTSFQAVLQALLKLRNTDINIPELEVNDIRVDWGQLTPFFHWAFTYERRHKLYATAAAVLEATKLQQKHGCVHVEVQVYNEHEREWAYEEWLAMMELQSGSEDVTTPKDEHVFAN